MYKTARLTAGVMLAFALANPVGAVEIAVPSGQDLVLVEILADENPGELWLRFRFIAPGIARDDGSVSHDAARGDMDWLCQNLALPYLEQRGLKPSRVVVSMADRQVVFGVTDPSATQFFEVYLPEEGRCILEDF